MKLIPGLQINQICTAQLTNIAPAQPYTFKRGDGRRLPSDPAKLATIPLEAEVTTKADFQAIVDWKSNTTTTTVYDRYPDEYWPVKQTLDGTGEPVIIYLGNANGTGRPNQSKILITADRKEAYGFITWTDLFGHSIKECATTRSYKGKQLSYLTKLTDVQRDRIIAAVADTGATI